VSTILKRASQRRKLFDKLKEVATLTFDSLTSSSAVLACGRTAEFGVLLTLRLALELEIPGDYR
jgi:hypothetical protein